MKSTASLGVALAAAAMVLPLAAARGGDLDRTFGDGGKVVSDLGSAVYANALAVQRDGKIVVGTYANEPTLLRFLPTGRLDGSFASGGSAATVGVRVALASHGRIVVGGGFEGEGDGDLVLARHARNGPLDPTFGRGGTVTTDLGGTVYLQGVFVQRGRIVAVGDWRPRDAAQDDFSVDRVAVVRYLPGGRLDPRFARRGTFLGLRGVSAVAGAPAPAGKVVVIGMRISGEGYFGQLVVARLTPRGRLDRSFSQDGIATANAARLGAPGPHALAVQPDGKVVVVNAGVRDSVYGVVRFRADGSRDDSFGAGISPYARPAPIYNLNAVRIDRSGRIVVAGDGPDIGQNFVVMRLTRGGHLDQRFGDNGTVTTDFDAYDSAFAVALQRDGKVLAGGTTRPSFDAAGRIALARYLGRP